MSNNLSPHYRFSAKFLVAAWFGIFLWPALANAADENLANSDSKALASPPEKITGPNIVFIYADDLGYGDLACHGHPDILTPNLDRLAREGTDFQQFTVANPVCSPSRAAILSGLFPSRLSIHQHFSSHESNSERGMPDWLDPSIPLLPKIFKSAGYATAHYGKWHLTSSGTSDAPKPPSYGYDDSATWTGTGVHVFDGTNYGKLARLSSSHDKTAASFLSMAATDHTLKFIRKSHGAGKRFYINLWLHETHHLVSATEKDKQAYPNTPEPQRTYYAAVTRADRQVGRVLELLDQLEIADNTLVIFSSDNGPENSHAKPDQKLYYSVGSTGELRGRKRSLLMGGVNVPFLVRWPGHVPAGRVDTKTAINGVDIFPTLLAAANIAPPKNFHGDGENVMAAFEGKKYQRSKPMFWFWQGKHSGDDWPTLAMREGQWGLVVDDSGKRAELYDLVSDRSQSKNLAADQPDRVTKMRSAINAWKASLPTEVDPKLRSKVSKSTATKSKEGPKTRKKTRPDRAAIFARKDINKDGKLTLGEYLNRFPDEKEGKRRFPNFDKNHDGVLSRKEFVSPNK